MPNLGEIREIDGRRVLVLTDRNGDELAFWYRSDGVLRGACQVEEWGSEHGCWTAWDSIAHSCGTTLDAIRARLEAANPKEDTIDTPETPRRGDPVVEYERQCVAFARAVLRQDAAATYQREMVRSYALGPFDPQAHVAVERAVHDHLNAEELARIELSRLQLLAKEVDG